MITYFNPLYDNYEGYDHGVKVECNYDVLTKQIEDLTADNEAEIGNDPVLVYKDMMWIGGGYLNIIFRQCLPAKENIASVWFAIRETWLKMVMTGISIWNIVIIRMVM